MGSTSDKTQTVLRWEFPESQSGPYIQSYLWEGLVGDEETAKAVKHLKRMLYRHNRQESHPPPHHEGLHIYDKVCGFKNKTQMNRWFTKANQAAMKMVGLELVTYKVDAGHVEVGKCQLTFNPRYATPWSPDENNS